MEKVGMWVVLLAATKTNRIQWKFFRFGRFR